MSRLERNSLAILALWTMLGIAQPLHAQIGSRLGLGVDKGKVYGLDVRETPSIVFVVDFAIHEGPGYIDQVEDVATGDASSDTQQDVAQKTGESVGLAMVPGGMIVKAGLKKHRDQAGRAENNLKSAIDGLDDDQRFGIVYFDGGGRAWREALVEANDDNREAAEDLIDDLHEGKGFLSSATMGLSDKVTEDDSEPKRVPPSAEELLSGMRRAFALGPETIVVVVAESPPDARSLINGVARLNADRRVVIHTAGFTEEKDAPSALRDLARANGGVYLFDDTPDDEEAEN